jgi:fatty acid desaturase
VGWEIAARMTVLEVVVSLTMFEMRFQSWQQLPFTCSYAPGKRPLVMLLAGWLAAIGVAVPMLTIIISTASRMTVPFLIYLSMFVGVWIWARRFRRDGWGEAPMLYEDLPDALPDLGLRG